MITTEEVLIQDSQFSAFFSDSSANSSDSLIRLQIVVFCKKQELRALKENFEYRP